MWRTNCKHASPTPQILVSSKPYTLLKSGSLTPLVTAGCHKILPTGEWKRTWTLGMLGIYSLGFRYDGVCIAGSRVMENQMEKNMEHETEAMI